jgi:hypothetical protein
MLRDPDQPREFLSNFAATAAMFLHLEDGPSRFESIAIHFAALLTIAPPNSIPTELLEQLCDALQGIKVFSEIPDDRSPSTQLILSMLAYDAGTLTLIWPCVDDWTQLAEPWAVACALALAFEVWPLDHAVMRLTEILEEKTVESFLHVDVDVDVEGFKRDLNAVQMVAIPIFPTGHALEVLTDSFRASPDQELFVLRYYALFESPLIPDIVLRIFCAIRISRFHRRFCPAIICVTIAKFRQGDLKRTSSCCLHCCNSACICTRISNSHLLSRALFRASAGSSPPF